MSPEERNHIMAGVCFPRVSGDEPLVTVGPGGDSQFSPRERG